MKALNSKYVQMLCLGVCQIITFIVAYKLGWRLYVALRPYLIWELAWGITVYYAFVFFIWISVIGALIGVFITLKYHFFIQLLSIFTFAVYLFNAWSSHPYRTSFLMASGVMGFLLPFYLLRRLFGSASRILEEPGEATR
jgi:hypothetical protein